MILVDSSVLIDLIEDHPHWRIWSEGALVRASSTDDLAINVISTHLRFRVIHYLVIFCKSSWMP